MPSARRLAQPVKRAVEPPNLAGHFKAGRRLHVDGLVELAVEKRRLNVDLMQLIVVERDGREEGAQRRVLADGRKHLVEINALALIKALGDDTRLVADKVAVCVVLVSVDPLEGERLFAERKLGHLENVVGDERRILVVHGELPVGRVVRGDRLVESARRRRRFLYGGAGERRAHNVVGHRGKASARARRRYGRCSPSG